MLKNQLGTLYVVATPIGNLLDMSLRAIEVLKSVALIAAEDTRHSGKLLKHFAINTPTMSFHDHNEEERINKVISLLKEGTSVALISDAGTPLISDPGYRLVKTVREQDIAVVPVPGACAAIAALSAAGLATDKFTFIGFLPVKAEAAKHYLHDLLYEDKTLIFYVAPHRLLNTLTQMLEVFGQDRIACVAREITKIYENIKTKRLQDLYDYYHDHPEQQCGEVVLLVAGTSKIAEKIAIVAEDVLDILLAELPLKQAAHLCSKITGKRKNEMYDLALTKKPNKS